LKLVTETELTTYDGRLFHKLITPKLQKIWFKDVHNFLLHLAKTDKQTEVNTQTPISVEVIIKTLVKIAALKCHESSYA